MLVNRMSAAAIFYLTLVAATPSRPTLLICTSLPTLLLLQPTLICGLVHKSNALITTGLLTLPRLRTIVLPTRDMTLGSMRCGPAIILCLAPASRPFRSMFRLLYPDGSDCALCPTTRSRLFANTRETCSYFPTARSDVAATVLPPFGMSRMQLALWSAAIQATLANLSSVILRTLLVAESLILA